MAMPRINWHDLPAITRAAVAVHTGAVHTARTAGTGINSGIALHTDHGLLFVKGVPTTHPQARTQQREAAINPHLPMAQYPWRCSTTLAQQVTHRRHGPRQQAAPTRTSAAERRHTERTGSPRTDRMSAMARRTARTRKREPDPPLGPTVFDPAPAEVEQDALWDCVVADDSVVVPSHVADWEIRESRIVGVDLAARGLSGFRCRDTHFVRCDLSGAMLDGATFERVAFRECRLTGAALSGTQLVDVLIDDCRADLLNLRMAHARHVLVENSVLRAADLTNSEFANSAFLRCDMREAILDHANLAGTRLHGSELDGIRSPLALRSCVISADQQITVGALLLAALDIAVTDETSGR